MEVYRGESQFQRSRHPFTKSRQAGSSSWTSLIRITMQNRCCQCNQQDYPQMKKLNWSHINSDIRDLPKSIQPLLRPNHKKALPGNREKFPKLSTTDSNLGIESAAFRFAYQSSADGRKRIYEERELTPGIMGLVIICYCQPYPVGMFPKVDFAWISPANHWISKTIWFVVI